MKRRDALKNIGLAAGFAVVAPSFLSLLQSCSKAEIWTPSFLNSDEQTFLISIVDIILPKTESTPSASEVKVPQFIDKYINEVLETEDQEITKQAFKKVIAMLKPDKNASMSDVTNEEYKALLDKYLLLEDEIDKEREANPEAKIVTTSEFLNEIKWLTINAYTNSEEVGENILIYDPVPTEYYCGDLQELTGGKSYSL